MVRVLFWYCSAGGLGKVKGNALGQVEGEVEGSLFDGGLGKVKGNALEEGALVTCLVGNMVTSGMQ